jgi:uncharacterized protein DUF3108
VSLPVLACSNEPSVPTADIVSTIPWTAPEELTYALVNEDGDQLATGVHTIEEEGSNFVLRTRYESPNGNSDTTTIVVDAVTLKPASSLREIDNDNPDDEDRIEAQYTENEVLITIGEGERQSGLTVPEHAYDNDTSLFLWRTIAFAEGYETSYITIITNRRADQQVILRVPRKETVTVPAGQFEAWRLEIITANARQTAWIADTPTRPLVRYDNDRGTIFELTSPP